MDFIRNHVTLPTETDVNFYVDAILVDPEAVVFTVFDLVSSPPDELPVGVPNQTAERISTGHYYARFEVPEKAVYGAYKVVFSYAIRDNLSNIQTYALELPFNIVSEVQQPFQDEELVLIDTLRKVLRDNNPDAYYRFAPTLKTGEIKGFTRRTGYIWDSSELATFLSLAVDFLHGMSFGSKVGKYPSFAGMFRPSVIMVAAFFATYAEAVRWTSEQFQYDIDGVSLSIDRASLFKDLASGFHEITLANTEILSKSIRFTKGVKMTTSVSRGAILGPSIAHSPLINFISARYSV